MCARADEQGGDCHAAQPRVDRENIMLDDFG